MMMMSRRSFVKTAALAAAASAGVTALGEPPSALAQTKPGDEKFILSAPLTHSDWMLKPNIAWGPEGVQHMLDACKACGWSQVYWRVLDGGRSMYASKVVRASGKWDDDSFWTPQTDQDRAMVKKYFNMSDADRATIAVKIQAHDYASFDTLAEAVRYGHEIGLKIHAWVSINEDDHGWGLRSDFSKAHPAMRWFKRDDTPYHSQMSFAFPEVREYKLAICKELLGNYAIDSLFLDWIRTGDVRDNPQTDADGVAHSGYEAPLVEAFKKQFGEDPHDVPNGDPRWVRVRAEPQTVFMRTLHEQAAAAKKPVAVLVGHPWHFRGFNDKIDGNLRGLLLDVATWAREGLMDAAVAAGYYRDGGNAELAANALKKQTRGKCDVWTYAWVPQNPAEFAADCEIASKVGTDHILFWEADYIDDRANVGALKAAMSARAKWE